MHVIEARNVNKAVFQGLNYLLNSGLKEQSRNGTVLVAPGPVVTTYAFPSERVLFSPLRDANPFFHLMESLWMLDGRMDLEWPKFFNKRFSEYSDDGLNVHGAYGFRWRQWFSFDQLAHLVDELKANPTSRRAVLTMWSPVGDLVKMDTADGRSVGGLGGKDVPCNTHAYFDIRDGLLNMTVCCRSNDAIWGAYGANAVHFSILQEYMAAWLGVPVGCYRQFSNNFHAYTDVYDVNTLAEMAHEAADTDHYATSNVTSYPLLPLNAGIESFHVALRQFMEEPGVPPISNDLGFINQIAKPMYRAWYERKSQQGTGIDWILTMPPCDWKVACLNWITRRERKN